MAAASARLPGLHLDYSGVMSAWEKIGGNIFSMDEAQFDDPTSVTLDLSGWEASLNPPIKMESSVNIFASVCNLFSPAEMGLSYLPGAKESHSPSHQPPSHGSWSSQQVVPSPNFSNSDSESAATDMKLAALELKQEAVFGALGPLSSPALSTSSEAGVVPDVAGCVGSYSSTATSSCSFGVVPQPPSYAVIPTPPATAPGIPTSCPAPLVNACSGALTQGTTAAGSCLPSPKAGEEPIIRTRAECLVRYREKKARRLYTKKIRYQLRKINADKRPRIKGRFVKKEELDDYLKGRKDGDVLDFEEEDLEDLMEESEDE